MPSGLRETSKPQFEIYYEKPWGGVASNADPVDIADNQMATAQGVIDVNGALCAIIAVADPALFKFNPHQAGAFPYLIFNVSGGLYAVDQFGNIYLYGEGSGPAFPTSFNFLTQATDGPWAAIPMAVQAINGVAYITVPDRTSIYTFTPGTGVFALASAYVGGNIIGVLDDYLLQMNVNQTTDGEQPTRVNWSGPGEFSTWDPSVDRTAGFNTLPNLEDAITGFISLASVGIIVGEKGLIEMSPTGVGIQPFSFTSLWTSVVGQGILYPNTLAQYGQSTYGGTDTGIYKISTGGFQEVSGAARTAILGPVQESALTFPQATSVAPCFFAGNVLLYAFNSTYPTPHYVFVESTPQVAPGGATNIIMWFLNLETGAWFSSVVSLDGLVNNQNGTTLANGRLQFLKVSSLNTLGFNDALGFNNLPNLLIYGGVEYGGGTAEEAFVATLYIYNKQNIQTTVQTPVALNITSKQYEIKLGRQPTIRRVLVKAYGSGTLILTVSGVSFGEIVLDGSTNTKTYYSPGGIYTGEDPQLTITCADFKGVIVKTMMGGAYADGDVD